MAVKRIWLTLLTLIAFAVSSSQDASSAIIAGTNCAKVGKTQIYGGKKYSCIKLGKRLYWDNGTVLPNSKNGSTPVPLTPDKLPPANLSLREISLIEGQVTDWAIEGNGNLSVTVLIRWTVPADPNRTGFKIYYQNSKLGEAPVCDLKVESCVPASLLDPTVYEYSIEDPEAKTMSISKVRAYSLESFKVCAIPKIGNGLTTGMTKCATGMVNTLVITALPKPKLSSTDVIREGNYLKVTWQGLDSSGTPYRNTLKRIDVYIKNNSDSNPHWALTGFINSPGESFKLPINASSYSARITATSTTGLESTWSDEFTIPAYMATITAPGA